MMKTAKTPKKKTAPAPRASKAKKALAAPVAESDVQEVVETALLRGRVRLLQPKTGFRASIDTVFLAASVPVRDKQHVLDIGCGVGSAGLCVLARHPNMQLTGLEVQKDFADLARQNATLNGVADRCRFLQGSLLNDAQVPDNGFHAVLMNPPYQEAGRHVPSPLKNKALSHGEDASGARLEDWLKYAHRKLKQGGYLSIVHRTDRLDQIILTMEKRRWFGSLVIFPLWPHAGEDSRRVIIRARKERYAPAILKSGLVVHEKDGTYTPAAKRILEQPGAFELDT